MANQLLPFANGDTPNILDFASWNSLPARLTGFQSGIASSQQFNYILAQGGAAGYVIGQLVDDFTNQDATLQATALYTAFKQAIAAFVPSNIANGSITSAKLADGSVTTAKLANDAVTAAKLADNSVGTEHIQANAVTASEIASNAVTTAKIANAAVSNAKLGSKAVATANIQDGAVTGTQIANGAVGFSKIASGDIATQVEAEAGTANNVLMTPLRTAQAIDIALAEIPVQGDGTTIKTSSEKLQAVDIAINGALSDLASNRGQIGNVPDITDPDFNDYTQTCFFRAIGSNQVNNPAYGTTGFVLVYGNQALNYSAQFFARTLNSSDLWFRANHGGTWQPWRQVILDVNALASYVSAVSSQTFNNTQKQQARTNIGVNPDGTTITSDGSKIVARDIAIGGNGSDLASNRGQIGNAKQINSPDFNTLLTPGIYNVRGAPTNGPAHSIGNLFVSGVSGSTAVITQVVVTLEAISWRQSSDGGKSWNEWKDQIANTNISNGLIYSQEKLLGCYPVSSRQIGSQPGTAVVVTIPNLVVGSTLYMLFDAENNLNDQGGGNPTYDLTGLTDNSQIVINNPQNRSFIGIFRVVAESTVTVTMNLNGSSDMSIIAFGYRNE